MNAYEVEDEIYNELSSFGSSDDNDDDNTEQEESNNVDD